MRHTTFIFSFLCYLAFVNDAVAQPFHKGINLTGWFQASNARQIQFSKYRQEDIAQMKSLGCDVIRLPINLHAMTNGSPNYTLDTLFLKYLDQAVDWAEAQQIYIILDNHTFDPAVSTSTAVGTVLNKVWLQVAEHYKNRSKYVLYEVLNEPHGISNATWATIQGNAIDAIRKIDTKHTIVVGAANWNTYYDLQYLPQYADTNLIYTFHFYDPFIFTHQGADWTDPSMINLAGVPFPYSSGNMPACPANLKGTWIESNLNNYVNDGNLAAVKSLIDIAVNFKNSRNVKVFCGEYGVYNRNSNNSDRVNWYAEIRKYFEQKHIAWTTWDYQGGFGLFNKNSNELFDYDLNIPLVSVLGFQVPAQKVFKMTPDSVAFPLYFDNLGRDVYESSNGSSDIDFFRANAPFEGKYSISWQNGVQYSSIGFDFKPNKDFSYLVENDFSMYMNVKATNANTTFDIRFTNAKTNDILHPWRMGYTVNKTNTTLDGQWHQIKIPLKSFVDQGAWDNAWFPSEGAFDWGVVDRFDIVAESENMTGKPVSFDAIFVSNQDVFTNVKPVEEPMKLELLLYPNPAHDKLYLQAYGTTPQRLEITISNTLGKILLSKTVDYQDQQPVELTLTIVENHNVEELWFVQVRSIDFNITKKISITNR